jgi:hypothetical protein
MNPPGGLPIVTVDPDNPVIEVEVKLPEMVHREATFLELEPDFVFRVSSVDALIYRTPAGAATDIGFTGMMYAFGRTELAEGCEGVCMPLGGQRKRDPKTLWHPCLPTYRRGHTWDDLPHLYRHVFRVLRDTAQEHPVYDTVAGIDILQLKYCVVEVSRSKRYAVSQIRLRMQSEPWIEGEPYDGRRFERSSSEIADYLAQADQLSEYSIRLVGSIGST